MQILKTQMTLKALPFHNPIHELSTQATVEQQAAFKETQTINSSTVEQ